MTTDDERAEAAADSPAGPGPASALPVPDEATLAELILRSGELGERIDEHLRLLERDR